MIYLTGQLWAFNTARHPALGVIVTPESFAPLLRGEQLEHAHNRWAADNGCYTLGARFAPERWLAWLEQLAPWKSGCLFAAAPDVVGDHTATWHRSAPYLEQLRASGYPAALVAQDGLTPSECAWDRFDVLFIGGTDAFKLGPALELIGPAKEHGKWVHMGRVNSRERLMIAHREGCDSADGNVLRFDPQRLPKLLAWLDQVNAQRRLSA